ncbi:MAG TPA: hypothetical protein VJB95_00920 [Candidatus Paceibacterota bacterium]
MKSFETYKKVLLDTAELGLVHYRVGNENTAELLKEAIAPSTGRADRLVAIFKLINEFLPKNPTTEKAIYSFLYDSSAKSRLPFDLKKFSYKGKIGSGAMCQVFLLESKEEGLPSYVIKIQRNKYNNTTTEQATEEAGNSKKEYESIKDIYKDLPEVIPKEFTIVIANPTRSRMDIEPNVAFIQRFYGKDIRDFFKEITPEEIVSLCRADAHLLATIKKFIDITLKTYEEKGIVVDFFGLKNLAIINEGNKHSLILLDPHIIYREKNKENWNILEADKAIEYLLKVQGLLSSL